MKVRLILEFEAENLPAALAFATDASFAAPHGRPLVLVLTGKVSELDVQPTTCPACQQVHDGRCAESLG